MESSKKVKDMSMISCPYCGLPHPSTAQYCPETGMKIAQISEQIRELIIIGIVGILLLISGFWLLNRSQTEDGVRSERGFAPFPTEARRATPVPTINRAGTSAVRTSEASRARTSTARAYKTSTPTTVPSATKTQTITPSVTPTATSSPLPIVEPERVEVNAIDGAELVQVPAGEFLMGSNSGEDPFFWGAEGPQHPVYLDAYWIYRTEVTNAMYQGCVEEQKCPRPVQIYAVNAEAYYENSLYEDYPVIYVSFTHAAAYCHWAGGRLPTEAEWEKAARGTDARLFPWGNDFPGSDQANLCDQSCARGEIIEYQINDGYSGTSPVASFVYGQSPYGAFDMAGNVWEWTFDWFQSTFYTISPYENPNGPVSGTRHVIRGGSWSMPGGGVRTVARISKPPDTSLDTLGFRCVIDRVE